MKTMTIRQFLELTGMSQATIRRKLIHLNAAPVGISNQGKASHLWALTDLEKAFSLIGVYSSPRGRPRKLG